MALLENDAFTGGADLTLLFYNPKSERCGQAIDSRKIAIVNGDCSLGKG